MRWFWILAAGAVVGGCTFGARTCQSQADCEGGACVSGFCVAPGSGGGKGGGSGTGGGGAAGGGAGGGTGGGGGGQSNPCASVVCPQEWEECVVDAGAACVSRFTALEWTQPADAGPYGPTTPVVLELKLTLRPGADASGFVPATLSHTLDGADAGTLQRSGTTTQFGPKPLSTTSLMTGSHLVKASYANLIAQKAFTVDVTAPVVTLHAQVAPMRGPDDTDLDTLPRWKKSESALLQVESDEPLANIQPADFTVGGVATSNLCTRPCGANKSCSCFAVPLGPQQLVAPVGSISGTVSVGLMKATDVLGNTNTAIAPQTFAVTRFKWVRELSGAMGSTPTGLAVTPSGEVIAGALTSLTASTLKSFKPDGGVVFSNDYATESMTTGPVVGALGIYSGASGPGAIASIRKLDFSGLAPQVICSNAASLAFQGDLALVNPGATEVVVAMRSDKALVSSAPLCPAVAVTPDPGVPNATTKRPSLVVSGTSAFLGMSHQDLIRKFINTNTTPAASGSISTQTLYPSNLFVLGVDVVGGGGGPTIGGVFAFNPGGVLSGSTVNATPGASPGGAAVVGGDAGSPLVFYGDGTGSLRRVALNSTGPSFGMADAGQLGGSLADRAPLLGRGGKVYLVGDDGALRAVNATTLTEEWRWSSAFPVGPTSQLSLDINRDSATPCAAGQPGVLYVAASNNSQTRLYAVLVDSQGLDLLAPWPKHQHNPANTGNAATSLAPWTCP